MNTNLLEKIKILNAYDEKYSDVIKFLKIYPYKITSISQLNSPIFTKIIKSKINEYLQYGEIIELEKIDQSNLFLTENKEKINKTKFINKFSVILGSNYSIAEEWWNKGCRNILDIQDKINLSSEQKIGLKYYNKLKLFTRKEILILFIEIYTILNYNHSNEEYDLHIVGDYRLGSIILKEMVILVRSKKVSFIDIIKYFQKNKLFEDIITVSNNELSAIIKLNDDKFIKIILINTPVDEVGSYKLWFTGNNKFLKYLIKKAKGKKMLLSQHGLHNISTLEKLNFLNTEEDILNLLDSKKYLDPKSRNI